ncbi:MAG: C10 family peptidase [Muribaculaceae bacterium]|nr:C10 family peptidase [Muribaculaceae bacterium]
MYRKSFLIGVPMLVTMMLAVALNAEAKQIDKDTAASIAENFFNSRIIGTKAGGVKAKSVSVDKSIVNVSAEPAYYVFAPEAADGFVIVSAEENSAPIVGYSLDAKFDGEKLPDALKAYLSDYTKVVNAISDGKIEYKPQTKGGEAVAPLMKVKWNQGNPYNLYTPNFGDKQAPTGCVATAIAQVMKYYEFPPKGNGTVTCGYGSQELGQAYDWSNMLDEYTGWDENSYNYTAEQAEAVATLMRDIGYSVNMSYGANESAAPSAMVASAMCKHFNYSPDIRYRYRDSYTTQAWIDEIRENLLRGEPVLYSGTDGMYGHEFVCDGIDAEDFLHINWGWGGMSDGYFDVSILSPDNLGIGAGNGAYYRDQDMVVNIRPGEATANYLETRLPLTLGEIYSYNETDADGKLTNQSSISLNALCWNSTGADVEWGEYSLGAALKDDKGQLLGIYGLNSVSSIQESYGKYVYGYLPCGDMIRNGELPDGHYTMSIACVKGNGYDQTPDNYDVTEISAGDLNRLAITVKDGVVYVDDPENMKYNNPAKIKLVSFGSTGKLYTGMNQEITLKMKNEGERLFSKGSFTMFLVPEAEDKAKFTEEELVKYESGYTNNVYLYPDVALDVPASLNTYGKEAGKYRLYVGNWDYDGSEYKLKGTDEPMWVELVDLPTDNVVITGVIKNYWPEIARSYYPWVDIKFNYVNPMGRFQTELQVWCHKKGSDEADEFLLYKDEESRTLYGSTDLEFWGYGERKALWYEELGTEFVAYIKYVDKDGNLKKMDGNNTFEFTLVEDDTDVVVNMTSSMVINDGEAVEAKDGNTFEVAFEMTTKTAITLSEEESYMRILSGPMSDDWLYLIGSTEVWFEKKELAAGETTKCHVVMRYIDYEPESYLIGSTLCIEPIICANDRFYSLQVTPFLESTAFALVEPKKDAIDDITADSMGCIVKTSGQSIIVENLGSQARVDVYNVAGVKIGEATSGLDGIATIDVRAGGIYLVRVTDTESGVASTVKVRI